ncbi:hypothetical protein KVR01_000992 [Diaporthe batatas]|uniref:uncharacterized protein n=1 Tax=Diaporthe batatas TaxID=748121 RepID=UPI001D04D0C3|nr:uncharacterized protein KVR01_000992 [Diaporthe batatas]KAG8170247.1 hypothetical protein KVR01_000992 [Diaporthe batatas]
MSSRLKSILKNPNRVRKKPAAPKRTSSSNSAAAAANNNNRSARSSPSSSSWSDSLTRTKPGASTGPQKKRDDEEEDYFHDKLDDVGLVQALATDLTLRDVPQAMRYSRGHMFVPMPGQPHSLGLSSTRVAEVLQARKRLPPVVTVAHLQALLRSPTAVDREVAELVRAGALRKIIVLRRARDGGVGELLVVGGDLHELVRAAEGEGAIDAEAAGAFCHWLQDNPAALKVCAGDGTLGHGHVDQLVRAGFLTTAHDRDVGSVTSLFARPEDRGTNLSLAAVSRAAAGSIGAVGGDGAVHASGGSGARSGGSSGSISRGGPSVDLSLAVPGQGPYLRLVSAALSQLTGILTKSDYREMPETLLRERWDGGVAKQESKQHASKRLRREFAGVLPARTRKWRDFHGMTFEWVLHEAVGAGLVEVFETGSVGRGVRLL